MNLIKLCKNHKWIIILIILFSILTIAIINRGKELESKDLEGFSNYLNREVPNLLARYDISGANIALIEDSSLAWVVNYGYANRK